MNLPKATFWICMSCVFLSTSLTVYIFAASRQDPGLRMAALVGASNIATALMATASTLLTGKDLTNKNDPANLPPGSVSTSTDTVQTPPVTINPIPPAVEPAQPAK